ncbi:MAG: glycosyl hydrolase-related protein, partial [Ruminococcus sp.]|nr:glycosyl hydrolase-related protein [Ruminococcus sp.]
DIGLWYGVSGKPIFASLDAKSYCTVYDKVRNNSSLTKKLNNNNKKFGLPWTFGYHGVGDIGGAPKEKSVATVQKEINSNDSSEIKVLSSSVCDFFDDMSKLDPVDVNRLPKWNNELPMTNHGVGSYTARGFSKRCNRRNEELADMAERSAVIASNVCSFNYPTFELERSWKRLIAHTFHDDITGTSVQRAYQRSWNDYIMSANQFTNAYEGASAEIIRNMDTSWTKGVPVVINNSIEQNRIGVVDFTIPSAGYKYIRVFDKSGAELPSQVNYCDDSVIKASVCVGVQSLGYKVVDVLYSFEPCTMNTGLRADKYMLENFKYIVTVNKKGDIASIIDKTLDNTELLEKPIRFELNKYEGNKEYPAWELTYNELSKYPWEFAEYGTTEIVENGSARVTLKVRQYTDKSAFTYYVSLTSGGQCVEVYNEIEWREFSRALHNGFYFTAKNNTAIFDLGLGAIPRKKANKNLYAVPAQKWVDISDANKGYGVSVFSDSKYGWIMKDESSLRMTVIHTPKHYFRHDSVQGMLDFGHNRYSYAIYSHKGDYTNATQFNARAFNQPMAAFVTNNHPGPLGNDYSFGSINNSDVIIRAIKKAEDSNEVIVRVNEGANRPANGVELSLGKGILSAREVYASEEEIGPADVENGKLKFDLAPYEVKTFALTLAPCKVSALADQKTVDLPYNVDIVTFNNNRGAAKIPTINVSVPGEIFPKTIECGGVRFETGGTWASNNAVICAGQKIKVTGNRFYFIAASLYGDKGYNFDLGNSKTGIMVQSINERIGGWDLYELAETAFIKTDKLAWECTHTHADDKDNVASQLYFFMYEINTEGVSEITLPDDSGLIILAATEVFDNRDVRLATQTYDRINRRTFDYKMTRAEKSEYNKMKKKYKKEHNKT